MHDATVDRTDRRLAKRPLTALTAAQLAQLDAGYRFSLDAGTRFPDRGAGIGVPTLRALSVR